MKWKRWGQKGFSLVEVMVVSMMVAGMGLTLAVVLRVAARGWQAGQNQMTTSSELRRGIHAIARELAQTRNDQLEVRIVAGGPWVAWPAGNPGLAAGTSYLFGIRFRVPEIVAPNTTVLDAGGAVTWSANPIIYDLAPVPGGLQQLQRTQAGPALTLAYGVTALSFRRQAATPSVLEMTVTVQRGAAIPGAPTSGEAQPVPLSTRIRLRN